MTLLTFWLVMSILAAIALFLTEYIQGYKVKDYTFIDWFWVAVCIIVVIPVFIRAFRLTFSWTSNKLRKQ